MFGRGRVQQGWVVTCSVLAALSAGCEKEGADEGRAPCDEDGLIAQCGSVDPGASLDGGATSLDAGTAIDASIRLASDTGVSTHDAGVARIQLIGFNDFHGNIEPPLGSSGSVTTGVLDGGVAPSVPAGGAAFFAQHVAALRAQNPNTLVVSAGDLIGASPLVSALFHDEPTIEAMNLIGLDISAVGNHEFDEGKGELLRMQSGGCHPVDGCQDQTPFTGASFEFLASNVIADRASGDTLFDRYTIRELDGVKIAFIGMTLEATPTIVTPSGVAGLTFADEADTVNAIVPQLQAQGVHAIVVLIHEGGFQTGLYDECQGISGEIVGIVERLHTDVDLVISGHTHAAYNCVIQGKRVTSALSFGRLITEVQLSVDRTTQDVVALDAENRIITREVVPLPAVEQLVTRYVALAAPLRDRVIGEASVPLTRGTTPSPTNSATGEGTLGDVIADSQRSVTLDPARSEPHVAFMNPGGVRADLEAGPISYGEAFTIQPFGNSLVTLTLRGAQLDTLLEQQFTATATRILYPSANVSYSFDLRAPLGERVSGLSIDGVPVDPARSYRVTVNSFLATGGDGFVVLNEGTERVGGDVDIDALEKYVARQNPLLAPAQDRITRLN
jgi:5'-nucleotidase